MDPQLPRGRRAVLSDPEREAEGKGEGVEPERRKVKSTCPPSTPAPCTPK